MESSKGTKRHVTYSTYILVWLGLIVFTCVTVAVTSLDLRYWNIGLALLIATIKTSLVLLFFMHLKYEKPLFKIMFLVAVITLTIMIAFTFLDILFR